MKLPHQPARKLALRPVAPPSSIPIVGPDVLLVKWRSGITCSARPAYAFYFFLGLASGTLFVSPLDFRSCNLFFTASLFLTLNNSAISLLLMARVRTIRSSLKVQAFGEVFLLRFVKVFSSLAVNCRSSAWLALIISMRSVLPLSSDSVSGIRVFGSSPSGNGSSGPTASRVFAVGDGFGVPVFSDRGLLFFFRTFSAKSCLSLPLRIIVGTSHV